MTRLAMNCRLGLSVRQLMAKRRQCTVDAPHQYRRLRPSRSDLALQTQGTQRWIQRYHKHLGKRHSGQTLYLFDEPATGLHESDLVRLTAIFSRLAERGDLVIAAEHRRSLVDTADWEIELGPESGALGGALVAQRVPGDDS